MSYQVDKRGYYGPFGGAFIPEMLHENIEVLQEKYLDIIHSEEFQTELQSLLRDYVGRPTPLYFAKRLSEIFVILVHIKSIILLVRFYWRSV